MVLVWVTICCPLKICTSNLKILLALLIFIIFKNDLAGDSAHHLLPGLLCREGRGQEVDFLGELLVTIDGSFEMRVFSLVKNGKRGNGNI